MLPTHHVLDSKLDSLTDKKRKKLNIQQKSIFMTQFLCIFFVLHIQIFAERKRGWKTNCIMKPLRWDKMRDERWWIEKERWQWEEAVEKERAKWCASQSILPHIESFFSMLKRFSFWDRFMMWLICEEKFCHIKKFDSKKSFKKNFFLPKNQLKGNANRLVSIQFYFQEEKVLLFSVVQKNFNLFTTREIRFQSFSMQCS